MALGLAQYVLLPQEPRDPPVQPLPNPSPRSGAQVGRHSQPAVAVVVVVAIAFEPTGSGQAWCPSRRSRTGVIILASIASLVITLTSSKVEAVERTRVRAFIPLFIANAVFWSLFQQIFTVLSPVYSGRADELVDLRMDSPVELGRFD